MPSLRVLAPLTVTLGATLFAACGDTSDSPGATTTTSAATTTTTGTGGTGGTTTAGSTGGGGETPDAGPDVGVPSDKYPAPHPGAPKALSFGGPVLKSPEIVSVFFADDEPGIVASIKDFESKIGGSDYWTATTKEYGVNAAKLMPFVDLAEDAPDTITDADLQTWLAGKLNSDDPAFPVPTENTVVSLHYPPGSTVSFSSGGQVQKSCQAFLGYHSSITLDAAHGNLKVAYAVTPRCSNVPGMSLLQAVTVTESHELIEASTDPYPQVDPAYGTTDSAHIFWILALGGGEVSDLCALFPDVNVVWPGLDYMVQRSWSNKAASASHDPCVPVLPGSGPYFNAVPVAKDVIKLNFGGQGASIKGIKIPVGESKVVDIQLFSDGDTGGPFTVQAFDDADLFGGQNQLSFSWDQDHGENGQTLHLTIKVLKGSFTDGEYFYLASTLGKKQNYWIGIVGNK
ncbi:MAG: hypothetical protein U0359_18220 [Byssovorax sp.]